MLIPELLRELPWHFFVTSAIDALIHAIESYVSPKSNLYTRMFAKKAMEMLLSGFRKLAEEGQDSLVGNICLKTSLWPATWQAFPLEMQEQGQFMQCPDPSSGVYHVTHGEANYQFLTAVFQAYQERDPEGGIRELNTFLAGILNCDADEVYIETEKLLEPPEPAQTSPRIRHERRGDPKLCKKCGGSTAEAFESELCEIPGGGISGGNYREPY